MATDSQEGGLCFEDCDAGSVASTAIAGSVPLSNVAVAWEGLKPKVCKLCACKSDDRSPLVSKNTDARRPWLHYYPHGESMKKASGRLCLICWNVFRQSGLEEEHDNLTAYLKWKGNSVERHHGFMKAFACYVKEHNQNPSGKRRRLVFTYTKDTRSESKEETESGKV